MVSGAVAYTPRDCRFRSTHRAHLSPHLKDILGKQAFVKSVIARLLIYLLFNASIEEIKEDIHRRRQEMPPPLCCVPFPAYRIFNINNPAAFEFR